MAESWTDNPGDSHIHCMYGHIDEFLYKYVAGIQGVGPHGDMWGSVRVAPQPLPHLHWVNATFESPRGLVASAYHWAASEGPGGQRVLDAEVVIPPGVTGVWVSPVTGREQPLVPGATFKVREVSKV